MDTTKESFQITLNDISSAAVKLGMLRDGWTLKYRHNGAGNPPYVYAVDKDGNSVTCSDDFLPEFTARFTRRESMAALEACARALEAAARAAKR